MSFFGGVFVLSIHEIRFQKLLKEEGSCIGVGVGKSKLSDDYEDT